MNSESRGYTPPEEQIGLPSGASKEVWSAKSKLEIYFTEKEGKSPFTEDRPVKNERGPELFAEVTPDEREEGDPEVGRIQAMVDRLRGVGYFTAEEPVAVEVTSAGDYRVTIEVKDEPAADPENPVDDMLYVSLVASGKKVSVEPSFDDDYNVVGMEYLAKAAEAKK